MEDLDKEERPRTVNLGGMKLKWVGVFFILLAALVFVLYYLIKPLVGRTYLDGSDFRSYSPDEYYFYIMGAFIVLGVAALFLSLSTLGSKKQNECNVLVVAFAFLVLIATCVCIGVGIADKFGIKVSSPYDNLAYLTNLDSSYFYYKRAYLVIFSPYIWLSVAALGALLAFIGGVSGFRNGKKQAEQEAEQEAQAKIEEQREREAREKEALVEAVMSRLSQNGTVSPDELSTAISAFTSTSTSEPQEQPQEQAESEDERPELLQTDTLEYIQPKTSQKGKKAIMISLIVSYSLLLVAAILFVSVPSMGKILVSIGMVADFQSRAYTVTIGMLWFSVLPSIGYYFATISPYELDRKKRIIIFGACGAASAAILAVYFVVAYTVKVNGVTISRYYFGNDAWFMPLSVVVSAVGIAVCYILTLFKLRPENIATEKPSDEGVGCVGSITHLIQMIIYGIKKFAKSILIFKEKRPDAFIVTASILLTWLAYFAAFFVSIIILALLLCVVLMGAAFAVDVMSSSSSSSEQLSVDGVALTQESSFGYSVTYRGDDGNTYYSDDGGKTVYRK